ncbi:hypothetical protein VNO80_20902 [Phaseolus coccineus]|uniref:Uncharacterized protein n=1 Tax=Phaseolus coccineus TaxID=3886 RepID=A0AAN9QSS0_PHACN
MHASNSKKKSRNRCCREEGVAIWTVIAMERIHVSVRAKPLSQDDAKRSPWRIFGNSIAIPNLSKFDFGPELKEEHVPFRLFFSNFNLPHLSCYSIRVRT